MSTISQKKNSSTKVDPLYVIFEQHLFNFHDPDTDRHTFIGGIIDDYLGHLRKNNISVPRSLEQPIREELATQVNSMLVKKIYGCSTIDDYKTKVPTEFKKRAKSRYQKLATTIKRSSSG